MKGQSHGKYEYHFYPRNVMILKCDFQSPSYAAQPNWFIQDFQNSPGALAAAGGCTTGALDEDFGAADACAGVGLITTGVSSSS